MNARGCSTYILLNVKALLDSRTIRIFTVLFAGVLCIPLFMSIPTGGDYLFGQESLEQQRDYLSSQVSEGIYDSAPQDLRDLIDQETRSLDQAVRSDDDSKTRYEAIADYDRFMLQEYRKGYLNGVDTKLSLIATERLPHAISKIGKPEFYGTTSNMPGLYLLAYYGGSVPGVLWLSISVIVFLAALKDAKKRFADRGPLSYMELNLCRICAITVCAIIVMFAALFPCFIIATFCNGLGQPDYPVVFIQYGHVIERTLIDQCFKLLVHQMATVVVLVSIGVCVFSLLGQWIPSIVALCAFGGASLLPLYADGNTPWAPLLPFLFSSYSFPAHAIGSASYANGAEVSLVTGGNESLYILVYASTLFISLIGICLFSHLARNKRWYWNGKTLNAPENSHALHIDLENVKIGHATLFSAMDVIARSGSIVGLAAPNGYGKTTLLNIIWGCCGHSTQVTGSMSLKGSPCSDIPAMRKSFFLVPNDSSLLFKHESVEFHLKWCAKLWGSPYDINDVLKKFDLLTDRHTSVSSLSDGNRQLLNIALAHISLCDVLLFDEPMNALDVAHVNLVSDIARLEAERGATVVISSHLLGNLESLCDSAVLLTKERSLTIRRPEKGGKGWLTEVYERTYTDR